jgi:CDGSH-type Zn-finger protein
MTATAIPAQKAPYAVEVTAGRSYFWCACGRSKKQPFCDSSHMGTSLSPLRFDATEDKTVRLCGCKATKNPPYCDGTHKTL